MSQNLPAHSTVGASSYERWEQCPGSVRLCEDAPKTESVYAAEGTEAHELAADILRDKPYSSTHPALEAVSTYVDFVKSIPGELEVEQRLDLSSLHPKLFGTADAVVYNPDTKCLTVVDYKHGQGVAVEAEANKQLLYYALGALINVHRPIKTVYMFIVQPRCYHPAGPIRGWAVTPAYMLDFMAQLIDDVKRTEASDAPLNPGDHCRWCAAKPTCPALREKSLALAKQAFAADAPYDPQRLRDTLVMLPAMEMWIKSVREFAYQEVVNGREIPGWKLVDKRSNRKWRDEQEVGSYLGSFLDEEQVYDVTLKSPAQIEKFLTKAETELLQNYVIKESSGTTLVPESDKRPKSQNVKPSITDAFSVIDSGELL